MFGSQILEVAISLVFVYLAFSLICSGIKEWIHYLLNIRSKALEEQIWDMLKDKDLVKAIYSHHLVEEAPQTGIIKKMMNSPEDASRSEKKISRKNTKISTASFSEILLDCITKAVTQKDDSQEAKKLYDAIQTWINSPGAESVKRVVKELIDKLEKTKDKVDADAVHVVKTLENWFDTSMEKLSAWYRRKTKQLIFVLALLLTVTFNVDSIMIIKNLSVDPAVRTALISQAQQVSNSANPLLSNNAAAGQAGNSKGIDTAALSTELEKLKSQLSHSGLPLGWKFSKDSADPTVKAVNKSSNVNTQGRDPRELPQGVMEWIYKVFGLLISLLAISMGAPFWYESLKWLFNIKKQVSGGAETRQGGMPPPGQNPAPQQGTPAKETG